MLLYLPSSSLTIFFDILCAEAELLQELGRRAGITVSVVHADFSHLSRALLGQNRGNCLTPGRR